MSLRRIRAVLFDLDETLYDRGELVREIFAAQHAAFRARLGGWAQASFVTRALALDDNGMGDKSALYETLSGEVPFARDLAGQLIEDFWRRYAAECRPSADTLETLTTLRAGGIKLGVITNGSASIQRMKLDSLGLGPLLDVVLISETEGIRKPDPALFRRALDRLGVDAGEAIFVGDNPEADVDGARGAGLFPVWRRRPYHQIALPGVFTVTSLSEILPLCADEGPDASTADCRR